jgi:hypothetical protein
MRDGEFGCTIFSAYREILLSAYWFAMAQTTSVEQIRSAIHRLAHDGVHWADVFRIDHATAPP